MHYYQRTRNEAKKMGLNLPGVIKFKVPTNNILSLSRSVFSPQPGTLIVDYYSAPITKYLKELNKWSMNYVADELVSSLGGIGEMQNFFKERMGFTSNDIELYSGSGLELYVDANGELTTDDDLGRKQRVDNLASCDAVMTTLGSLNDYLVKNQMGLSDVMLIDGVDPGTFSGPDSIENAAIVKTGTLNTAVALVGQISSKTGPYYFGIFFEIKNKNLWGTARNQINTMLKSLIKSTGGKKDIGPHTKETFLPFDSSSIYSVTIQPIPGTTHDELH